MNTFILLNYNDYRTTIELAQNIKTYKNVDHIVIVDNFSTDNSIENLSKLENEKIDIIQTDKNKGYSGGNNFGARYAISKYKPKYLFFANPDIEISQEIVQGIINFLNKTQNVGAVSCQSIITEGVISPSAWRLPTFRDCVLEQLIFLKKIIKQSNHYHSTHFVKEQSQVDVLSGSFFAVPSIVFEKVEGFDEGTFLYYEENILAYKLKEKGFNSYILNHYKYKHKQGMSIKKNIKSVSNRLKIAFHSRKLYCQKYLKVNKKQLHILTLTFWVGLFNYITTITIFRVKR